MLQVYIKRGKGLADPFITLRHAEWGHSQAFNMVLNSWAGDRPLISSSEQQQVPPTEQQHPAAAVGQQECINRRQKAFAGQMLRAEEAEPAAAEGPAVTKAKGEAANGAASNTTAKESDNNKRKGNKRKGSAPTDKRSQGKVAKKNAHKPKGRGIAQAAAPTRRSTRTSGLEDVNVTLALANPSYDKEGLPTAQEIRKALNENTSSNWKEQWGWASTPTKHDVCASLARGEKVLLHHLTTTTQLPHFILLHTGVVYDPPADGRCLFSCLLRLIEASGRNDLLKLVGALPVESKVLKRKVDTSLPDEVMAQPLNVAQLMNVAQPLINEFETGIPGGDSYFRDTVPDFDHEDETCGRAGALCTGKNSTTLRNQISSLMHGSFDHLACSDGQWLHDFLGCKRWSSSKLDGWVDHAKLVDGAASVIRDPKKHKQGVAKKHKQADNKQDKQADISLQNSLKALEIKRMPTTPKELKTVVQKQCCSLHFGCTKPGDRTDEEQKVCDEKLQVVRKANGHLRPLVGESRRR